MSENQKNLDNETVEVPDEVVEETPAEETAETAETAEPAEAADGKLKGADQKRLKKTEAELAETTKKLEAAEAALAEEKDKYLRMLAEYDNFRRRTAKEKDSIYGDAAAGLTPEDAESPLGHGITMILKSATDALAKMGVEEVPCDTFNPDIHNAVMHVEDESLSEGAIVAVFQKGYRKGDHIIRYAMVQVAN